MVTDPATSKYNVPLTSLSVARDGSRLRRRWFTFAACLAVAAGSTAHADPAADYASLFGDEEKKVLATSTTKDDTAFAAKLLARAADLKDAPELKKLVLVRAVEIGQKDVESTPTAIEAAKQLLATSEGADKLDWRSRIVDLYAVQYKKSTGAKRAEAGEFLLGVLQKEADDLVAEAKYADAVKRLNEGRDIARTIKSPRVDEFLAAAKEVQAKQQIADKYAKLRQRLDTQGGDVALLEQVILGYLLELSDPETAHKLSAGHPDKAWESATSLAVKRQSLLSEAECLQMAEHFRNVGRQATPKQKQAALSQSVRSLLMYLSLHEQQDAQRLQVNAQLKELAGQVDWSDPVTSIGAPVTADRIVIWNTNNAGTNTRGSASINVIFYYNGQPISRRDNIELPRVVNADAPRVIPAPHGMFDRIRIEVIRWHDLGGGLAEIEVLQGKTNVAIGAKVTASASFGSEHPATNLVDGITSTAQQNGNWFLPNRTAGWAEISINPGPHPPSVDNKGRANGNAKQR